MKKTIILSGIFYMLLGLTACFKEKSCTCTDPYTGETRTLSTRKSNSRASLKEFEEDCKRKKYNATNGYGSYSYGCEVK